MACASLLSHYSLRKRSGERVPFQIEKIQRAVSAAGAETGELGPELAGLVAQAVEVYLAHLDELDVEQVQDLVERQLMEAGFYRTARACILYRERRRVAGQLHA